MQRRRHFSSHSTVALLCGIAATAALGFARNAQAGVAPSASQLLGAAIRDAQTKGSVHETEVIKSGGDVITYRDDVTHSSGRQISTSTQGIDTEVLVVNGAAFLDGNQPAWRFLYGLSAVASRKIGTQWVSVPTSRPLYIVVVGDVTLPSALQQITPVGHLTETAATKLDGTAVVGIRGKAPAFAGGGTLTTYVSKSEDPLPIAAIYAGGSAGSTTASFTRWSEPLNITAPAHSVSITNYTR